MAVVTLKIDDIEVAAEQGQSILATAKEAGIQIPTLCHLEGVTDVEPVACAWSKSKAVLNC